MSAFTYLRSHCSPGQPPPRSLTEPVITIGPPNAATIGILSRLSPAPRRHQPPLHIDQLVRDRGYRSTRNFSLKRIFSILTRKDG